MLTDDGLEGRVTFLATACRKQKSSEFTTEVEHCVQTLIHELVQHLMNHLDAYLGILFVIDRRIMNFHGEILNPVSEKLRDRAHFSGAAAEAMRRILIDTGRRKRALRHGGGQQRVDIQEVEIADTKQADDLLALNDALEKLAEEDSQKAELVKLRYFAGLTTVEAAAMLHVSIPTADHWWAYSRTWLFGEVRRLLAADR